MPIIQLPPHVASQIAAGEVVERPSSIVKELVENSIDSGATRINVAITRGGVDSIRITDNGSGIPADQLQLAFASHATSKLTSITDLTNLATLGFRGEALPSIASVANVVCRSRTIEQENAAQLTVDYGDLQLPVKSVGSPVGTTIEVYRLFARQPARLKFLRTHVTEAAHCQRIVSRYAMAYPHIRFQYSCDQHQLVTTNGTGDLRETILAVYDSEVAQAMMPVHHQRGPVEITGYVAPPHVHRSSRNELTIFVNRRWIQDRNLHWAIEQAFEHSLDKGRHPLAVINIALDPELVDINAHPTKQEVRFRHERQVFGAVQSAIRSALNAASPPRPLSERPIHQDEPLPQHQTPPSTSSPTSAPLTTRQSRDQIRRDPDIWPEFNNSTPSAPPPAIPRRTSQRLRYPEIPDDDQSQTIVADTAYCQTDSSDHSAPIRMPPLTDALPLLTVLGQSQLTYIIATANDALFLIDQHAAHERVNYDQLVSSIRDHPIPAQQLIAPYDVNIDPQQAEIAAQYQSQLSHYGFRISVSSDGFCSIMAIPANMVARRNTSPQQALIDTLNAIENGGTPQELEHTMAATIACHSSVTAGDALNHEQMQSIVTQLAVTPEPHHCPHGRPTTLTLSKHRIETEFKRR